MVFLHARIEIVSQNDVMNEEEQPEEQLTLVYVQLAQSRTNRKDHQPFIV